MDKITFSADNHANPGPDIEQDEVPGLEGEQMEPQPSDGERIKSEALRLSRLSLEAGTLLRLSVTSGSMAPLLKAGDAVFVSARPPRQLRRGDLVVFQSGADLVTHRLVHVTPRGWITKGDRRWKADPPLVAGDILGIAVMRLRGANITDFRRSPWPLFNTLAGALAAAEIWVYQRLKRKEGLR